MWDKLTVDLQNKIKVQIFEVIYSENDLSMKKHIADSIGEIAGTIINKNDGAWPEFKANVWKLLQDSNLNSVFAGFYILESFLSYASEHFKDNASDLYSLFRIGLTH